MWTVWPALYLLSYTLSANSFTLRTSASQSPSGEMTQNQSNIRNDRVAWKLRHVTDMSPPTGSGPARTVDEELLRFLVQFEVAKAQRLHYCVSVVCLAIDSLAPSVEDSFARPSAERFVDRLRSTDVVAARPASSWTFLLVDAPSEALPSIVDRITEQLGPLPWMAGGATYPGTASSGEDLLRRSSDLAARTRGNGGHRLTRGR